MQLAESFLRAYGEWWKDLGKGIDIMTQSAGVTELDQERVRSVNSLIFSDSFQKLCDLRVSFVCLAYCVNSTS